MKGSKKLEVTGYVDSVIQVTVPVLCGILGWLFLELTEVKTAVSTIQEQQLRHDLTGELVAEMHETLIRLETSQQYVEREIRLLRESSKNSP
tara:strand:- start:277 stop:552 length:276 start_codon:yes stop_codon:yes gene_type:complete